VKEADFGCAPQKSDPANKPAQPVSRMEAILREDPAGIHARSDFGTRDRCRRVVEAASGYLLFGGFLMTCRLRESATVNK